MPRFRRKRDPYERDPHEVQSEPLVLMRAAPSEPARFSGSRTFGDFVVLSWETEYGTIGWAHPTHTAHTSAVSLSRAMYEHLWDHMDKAYTTLVVPLLLVNPDRSPELRAVDLYPGGRMSEEYEPTWHDLADRPRAGRRAAGRAAAGTRGR
jgi:hypothetical protein